MTQSQRKLVGTVGILLSLVLWSILGTALYANFFAGAPPLGLIAFFCVAGGSWFFPAAVLIKWMSRP